MQSSAAPPPPPPPPHLALCYAVLCCAVLCCAGGVLVLVLCCGVLVLCCCFNTEQAGDTPLLAAVGNCGTRLVKVLLDARANIEAAHKVGRLHRCCCCCCTWAHMSCAVDVWAWQNGLTPLLLAARYGLRKHITLLLEHGASVRAVDAVSCVASCCDARSVAVNRGGEPCVAQNLDNALTLCAKNGTVSSFQTLVAAGANVAHVNKVRARTGSQA